MRKHHHFKKIAFYRRPDIAQSALWEKKITAFIIKHRPHIRIFPYSPSPAPKKERPDLVIVLGGDGTILEAAQIYQNTHPLIVGLNLGHIGFLASIRRSRNFLYGIKRIIKGDYRTMKRMMAHTTVLRNKKKIFSGYSLNDITIQNLFGIVDLEVAIDNHTVQRIHGDGVIVATATGSTAYTLSAHGPIVMPDIKCFVITKLLDHDVPTPPLIIKRNKKILITINHFRKTDRFIIAATKEPADVVLASDFNQIVALRQKDKIYIKRSDRLIRFAEMEKNYFFKSLREKFSFH